MAGSQSHADDEYPDVEETAAAEERMIILLFIRERAQSLRKQQLMHTLARELDKLANEIEKEEHLR